jgi:hypothetical protein
VRRRTLRPRRLVRERLRERGHHVGTHSAGSDSSRWRRRSVHCANRRRGAHAVGTQQVRNDTALSAVIPRAFMVTRLDFECRIDNTGDRGNVDCIVETTNQSVWRVLRIVVCFGLYALRQSAERNCSGRISSLSQSKPQHVRPIVLQDFDISVRDNT